MIRKPSWIHPQRITDPPRFPTIFNLSISFKQLQNLLPIRFRQSLAILLLFFLHLLPLELDFVEDGVELLDCLAALVDRTHPNVANQYYNKGQLKIIILYRSLGGNYQSSHVQRQGFVGIRPREMLIGGSMIEGIANRLQRIKIIPLNTTDSVLRPCHSLLLPFLSLLLRTIIIFFLSFLFFFQKSLRTAIPLLSSTSSTALMQPYSPFPMVILHQNIPSFQFRLKIRKYQKRYETLCNKKCSNHLHKSAPVRTWISTAIQFLSAFVLTRNAVFEILLLSISQCEVIYKQQKTLKKHSFMNMQFHLPTPLFYSSQGQYIATPHLASPFYFVDYHWALNNQILSQNIEYTHYLQLPGLQQPALALPPQVQINSQEKQQNTITENIESQPRPGLQIQRKKAPTKKEVPFKHERKAKKCNSVQGNDRFIKKNTESNIVNQVFSFLWTPEKSKKFLGRILQQGPKMDLFYYLMQSIKVHCKSQLNRQFLKDLLQNSDWQNGFKKLKKKIKRIEEADYKVVCVAIRKLVLLYLREKSRCSIMTSKKMNMDLWKMHFAKCRELIEFLFQ